MVSGTPTPALRGPQAGFGEPGTPTHALGCPQAGFGVLGTTWVRGCSAQTGPPHGVAMEEGVGSRWGLALGVFMGSPVVG